MVEQNLSYKCKFAKSDGVDYIYAHVLSGLIEQPKKQVVKDSCYIPEPSILACFQKNNSI